MGEEEERSPIRLSRRLLIGLNPLSYLTWRFHLGQPGELQPQPRMALLRVVIVSV